MKIKLETILSSIALLTALAYTLGWLKAFYYFDAFGIGLASLGLSPQDFLFESWFVIENLFFLIILWWVVLKTQVRWAIALGVCYTFIPMVSHYAFTAHEFLPSKILIYYRHTFLKVIPFGMLLLLWIFHRNRVTQLRELSWPFSQGFFVLFILLILGWSVSTAKHFGSFDANRAMLLTGEYLSKVQVRIKSTHEELSSLEKVDDLYLLYATKDMLILWDRTNFIYGVTEGLRLVIIPRESIEWIRTYKMFQVQPGSQFL